MNTSEILERAYRIIGEHGVITKKNIKGKLNYIEVTHLARLGYLKKENFISPNFILVDVNGFYDFASELIVKGETAFGKKCLVRAHRLGSIEASFQLFKESVASGNYSESSDYLKKMITIGAPEKRRDYHILLFLLSYLTQLPEEFVAKAKTVADDFLGDISEAEAEGNIDLQVRRDILSRNFSNAKKSLYDISKERAFNEYDILLLTLLKEVVKVSFEEKELISELIRDEQFEKLVAVMEEIDHRRTCETEERALKSLAKEMVQFSATGKIEMHKDTNSENFLEAVLQKDYDRAREWMLEERFANPKRKLTLSESLFMKLSTNVALNDIETVPPDEKEFLQGEQYLANRSLYDAYEHYQNCLKINPNHSKANLAIFSKWINNERFNEAFLYFRRAYENATPAMQEEYSEYLHLLNYLIVLPSQYQEIAMNYEYGEEESISRLCKNKNFQDAKNVLSDTPEEVLSIRRIVRLALFKAVYRKMGKDKRKVYILLQEEDYEAIVDFLSALDQKRGLDKYEAYMLQIASDILLIREGKTLPISINSGPTFENALKDRDYERALQSYNLEVYAQSNVWTIIISLLKKVDIARREYTMGQQSKQLFESGEALWKEGLYQEAYSYYVRAEEINPTFQPLVKRMFTYYIMNRDFDSATKVFSRWNYFANKHEEYEYNTYLFLLHHITILPDELNRKAKTLEFKDMSPLSRGKESVACLWYDIITALVNKKFFYGNQLLDSTRKTRRLLEVENSILILASEAGRMQAATKAEMKKLVDEGKFTEFIALVSSLRDRQGLARPMEACLYVARDIVTMQETGQVVEATDGSPKTIFEAVKLRDYSAVEKINNDFQKNYLRTDNLLTTLINVALDTIKRINFGPSVRETTSEEVAFKTCDADELYTKGIQLYKIGEFYKAFEMFRQCLEWNPLHKGANFELFAQSCDLKNYSRAFEYLRVLMQQETQEEHFDNLMYIYLLNFITEVPEDLKKKIKDLWFDKIPLDPTSMSSLYYGKVYTAALKKNFIHSIGILKDLKEKEGSSSKLNLINTLCATCQTVYDRFSTELKVAIQKKEYQTAASTLKNFAKIWPLNILEKSFLSLVEDILSIHETGEIPRKTGGNALNTFYAIMNKDYRKARKFNRNYQLTNNSGSELLSLLLDDIIAYITEKKKGISNESLTQEEKITLEDMVGSGFVPDILSTIQSGVNVEGALKIYGASVTERYLIYITLAERYFAEGEEEAAKECLLEVEEIGTSTSLIGKYYRHVVSSSKKEYQNLMKPIKDGE